MTEDFNLKKYSQVFSVTVHVTESQNHGMVWIERDLQRDLVPAILSWAGTSFSGPGCLKPNTAWL